MLAGMGNTGFSETDVLTIRTDFPILRQQVHGNPLVYLDNAATTQVPQCVIDVIAQHYSTNNANVHRGIHTLSERSTSSFESARKTVARFIGAKDPRDVIFTSGSTASANMLSRLVEPLVKGGDVILVSALEHHANLVTWQQLCSRTGAILKIVPLDNEGDINLNDLEHLLLSHRVKLVAFAHVSNVLGTVSPVKVICDLCHSNGAWAVVDAAQSVRHEPIDVEEFGCDFLFFSGHKMLAPTGIGVLYGRDELLDALEPAVFGGEMVDKVTFEASTFECAPLKFEAGTPNYVGAIALAAAVDYLERMGRAAVCSYEHNLIERFERGLGAFEGVEVLGHPRHRAGCVSFVVEGVHPFDLATFMDKKGIALRSGSQCAQPLLNQVYGVETICRVSPAFYNTASEIDRCLEVMGEMIQFLRRFNR